MAGAMAGAAILDCGRSETLHTVSLTINNRCNLSCPHCYLQYEGGAEQLNDLVFHQIVESRYEHLAIVGKEPFADVSSVSLCARITRLVSETGKTVSVITNGLNLSLVPDHVVNSFSYLDISFDGGPETYQRYRKASLDRLAKSLRRLTSISYDRVNALHVLSSETLPYVDDLMNVSSLFDFRMLVFSPYVATLNAGGNAVSEVSLESIVASLSESRLFMDEPKALLLINALQTSPQTTPQIEEIINKYGLAKKVRLIAEDPLLYGIIRVTYDALALTPLQSLHPKYYSNVGIDLRRVPPDRRCLEKIYQTMRHGTTIFDN